MAVTPIGTQPGGPGLPTPASSTAPLPTGPDGRPRVSAAVLSTLRSLENWGIAETLPANTGNLGMALLEIEATLAPAHPKSYAVLLDRLFASLPMPPRESLTTWRELLAPYPPDVLKRATDHVLRTHKWETPPKIAQVIEAAESDQFYRRRLSAKSTLQKAIMRQGWDERDRMTISRTSRNSSVAKPKPLYPAV